MYGFEGTYWGSMYLRLQIVVRDYGSRFRFKGLCFASRISSRVQDSKLKIRDSRSGLLFEA